jgi:transposase-like protein
VNANQVFAWIKQHREGTLRVQGEVGPTLLAVRVVESEVASVTASPLAPIRPAVEVSKVPAAGVAIMTRPSGTLALQQKHGELKIECSPDRQALEAALRWLTR